MTEIEPSNSGINPQPPQLPAESLCGTAMGSDETNGLPESITTSNDETESDAKSESLGVAEAEKEKEKEKEKEPAPPVLYKVQYLDKDDKTVFSKESKEPMGVQNTLSALGKSVIEVITNVRIRGPYLSGNGEKEEPRTLISILDTTLKINSPAIITALQSVMEYYPDLSFSEDSNYIWEPYAALIHHEEELKAYRDQFNPNVINSRDELCQRNANAYEHLGILQKVLFERSGKAVETERQRHARGVATFEMLWLLFRPGTDVYCDIAGDGNYDAYVVKSVAGGMLGGRPSTLEIYLWQMDYDGEKIGRRKYSFHQPVYDGEKEITSLIVVPCEFWKEESKEGEEIKPLKKKLEERGKVFFKLAQRQCMDYDGTTNSWPKKHFKGLTMVDSEVYYADAPTHIPLLGDVDDTPAHAVSECLCHVCLKSKQRGVRPKTSRYSSYDNLYPETTKSLTDHQYFLCPPSVWAYIFKSRAWEHLNVYNFSNPTFDTGMIDTLVMEDGRRRMIKALAKNYQNKSDPSSQPTHKPWAADFVAGKGEGKIFLLHGKPGVGKTYTAECIAAYTKRPLLSLTISDIGTVPSEAETKLNHLFTRAKQWNAILLIDEADIYMERRENQDLTRNSLVSAFLRAMENCQSILFLTTNRVGSFDDAFVSRIHVSLYYPDFTEDDRLKVWKTFFDKLARDRKNVMDVPAETILYTTEPEVKGLKWNGREIRNAFQTAVALADFDGANEDGKIVLRKTHIQQIVHMSQEFKDYLKQLHRGDEAKRADRQRIRHDEFDAKD